MQSTSAAMDPFWSELDRLVWSWNPLNIKWYNVRFCFWNTLLARMASNVTQTWSRRLKTGRSQPRWAGPIVPWDLQLLSEVDLQVQWHCLPHCAIDQKREGVWLVSRMPACFQSTESSTVHGTSSFFPHWNSQYTLNTDASDVGLGAVLSQEQDGDEKVIAYRSKTLFKEQRRYCTTRKELLAVVAFIKQFRHYLLGREFKVWTDHSSLRWLCNFKEPQGQLARWLEAMRKYKFTIEHRDEKKHQNADSQSRMPERSEATISRDGWKPIHCLFRQQKR